MKVKQAKLAQALRGESSNIIDENKFELTFEKGMLHAKLKFNPKGIGPFIVFPANIAFLEYHEEEVTQPVKLTDEATQAEEKQLPNTVRGRPKK
jgi:predicted ATPase